MARLKRDSHSISNRRCSDITGYLYSPLSVSNVHVSQRVELDVNKRISLVDSFNSIVGNKKQQCYNKLDYGIVRGIIIVGSIRLIYLAKWSKISNQRKYETGKK